MLQIKHRHYSFQCVSDIAAPSASLVMRYSEVMGKPLRENEDITAYLTSQEAVQHIPSLLALRSTDTYAMDFMRTLNNTPQ